MSKQTTIKQAWEQVVHIVRGNPIFNLRNPIRECQELDHVLAGRSLFLTLTWERGWGTECRMTVTIQPHAFGGSNVDITWCSTGHSVESATVAVDLYREVLRVAAMVSKAIECMGEIVEG